MASLHLRESATRSRVSLMLWGCARSPLFVGLVVKLGRLAATLKDRKVGDKVVVHANVSGSRPVAITQTSPRYLLFIRPVAYCDTEARRAVLRMDGRMRPSLRGTWNGTKLTRPKIILFSTAFSCCAPHTSTGGKSLRCNELS